METKEIKGYKRGSLLYFERSGKKIAFDLKDKKFYRLLKKGDMKELIGTQAFFRKLSVDDVAESFQDKAYAKLMQHVDRATSGRATNFATVFNNVSKYAHLEGYLLLDIPFSSTNTFNKPVSIYPKEVLAFMKESRINFDSYRWEATFCQYPDLVNKLCTHVRKNHYLDLEVYRMVYAMVSGYATLEKFKLLTDAQAIEPRFERSYNGRNVLAETPYGCEYKALFSYLVRIDRTEACSFTNALTLYKDYLKMSREMERNKNIAKLREINPDLDINTIGYVGFGRIEKYPQYLRTRHDIVQKNYNDWQDEVDEVDFARNVNRGYAYAWGKYKMIVPKSSNDVKAEGATLHHCVASYISQILDGTTQILFMREIEDESLVTVEVRAGSIIQARGYNNRDTTTEEISWLKTFAKAKNLNYKDVKRDASKPTPPILALEKYNTDVALLRELSELCRAV